MVRVSNMVRVGNNVRVSYRVSVINKVTVSSPVRVINRVSVSNKVNITYLYMFAITHVVFPLSCSEGVLVFAFKKTYFDVVYFFLMIHSQDKGHTVGDLGAVPHQKRPVLTQSIFMNTKHSEVEQINDLNVFN